MIKVITDGQYTLTHERYTDDFGIERDSLDFTRTDTDGLRTHYPFIGNFKATHETDVKKMSIADYSEQEYRNMFQEQLRKVERN